jgi:hypothetical protein
LLLEANTLIVPSIPDDHWMDETLSSPTKAVNREMTECRHSSVSLFSRDKRIVRCLRDERIGVTPAVPEGGYGPVVTLLGLLLRIVEHGAVTNRWSTRLANACLAVTNRWW